MLSNIRTEEPTSRADVKLSGEGRSGITKTAEPHTALVSPVSLEGMKTGIHSCQLRQVSTAPSPLTVATFPPSQAHSAVLTGVPVGAGQAVSSHLRGRLVTTVQELLGAEHVAGVGHPIHAMQDVDLGRGSAPWTHAPSPAPPAFLLPGPGLGGPVQQHLFPPVTRLSILASGQRRVTMEGNRVVPLR